MHLLWVPKRSPFFDQHPPLLAAPLQWSDPHPRLAKFLRGAGPARRRQWASGSFASPNWRAICGFKQIEMICQLGSSSKVGWVLLLLLRLKKKTKTLKPPKGFDDLMNWRVGPSKCGLEFPSGWRHTKSYYSTQIEIEFLSKNGDKRFVDLLGGCYMYIYIIYIYIICKPHLIPRRS